MLEILRFWCLDSSDFENVLNHVLVAQYFGMNFIGKPKGMSQSHIIMIMFLISALIAAVWILNKYNYFSMLSWQTSKTKKQKKKLITKEGFFA